MLRLYNLGLSRADETLASAAQKPYRLIVFFIFERYPCAGES